MGTDQAENRFRCLVIQLFDVIVHADADVVIFLHDPVIFFSIAPQFIGLAGIQIAAAKITVIERWNVVRSAVRRAYGEQQSKRQTHTIGSEAAGNPGH